MGDQALITGSSNVLLQYGIAGVFIICLIIAVVYLARDNKRLQDARYQDAKEITTALREPLAEQAELSKRIYEILLTNGRGK